MWRWHEDAGINERCRFFLAVIAVLEIWKRLVPARSKLAKKIEIPLVILMFVGGVVENTQKRGSPAMPGANREGKNPLQCRGLTGKDGEEFMGRMIGYMFTWTTYGTWLQGDMRGYVKKGKVLRGNENLQKTNRKYQKDKSVRLTKANRQIVRKAILKEAERLGQTIYSMAVCSNHVHIVANRIDEKIGKVAGRYKRAGTVALKGKGFIGKVWTKGFDKRFCFDEKSLRDKIDYVRRHN